MPIPVTCSECSARLNAPDAAAGKALKCPKCGAKIVVPSSSDTEQIAPLPPKPKSPPVPPPAPPKVAEPIEEDFGGDDFDDEPKPKAKQRPREEDEGFEDEQPAPNKGKSKTPPKKKKNPLLIIGVIALVLFLVCGGVGVGVYFLVFNTAKSVVNNINDALKQGGNNTQQGTKLPVDPNIQVLNPTASFKFEASDKKGTPRVSNLLISENGKSLAFVYSNGGFDSITEVWDITATPKRLYNLKHSGHGIANGLIVTSEPKTYELADGKPSDKSFVGRKYHDRSFNTGGVATETSFFRWGIPFTDPKGRYPAKIFEDIKGGKTVVHNVTTNDERVEYGGVDAANSVAVLGLRPQNKVLLFDFASKKVTREITLAEPRPLGTIVAGDAPPWNGFRADPSLKWFAVQRSFLGKEPDPYEIFDENGNVILKLENKELGYKTHEFLPNRNRLVTGIGAPQSPFDFNDVGIVNLKTKTFDTILRGAKQYIEQLLCSADGSTVVVITKDLEVHIWDVSKLK